MGQVRGVSAAGNVDADWTASRHASAPPHWVCPATTTVDVCMQMRGLRHRMDTYRAGRSLREKEHIMFDILVFK